MNNGSSLSCFGDACASGITPTCPTQRLELEEFVIKLCRVPVHLVPKYASHFRTLIFIKCYQIEHFSLQRPKPSLSKTKPYSLPSPPEVHRTLQSISFFPPLAGNIQIVVSNHRNGNRKNATSINHKFAKQKKNGTRNDNDTQRRVRTNLPGPGESARNLDSPHSTLGDEGPSQSESVEHTLNAFRGRCTTLAVGQTGDQQTRPAQDTYTQTPRTHWTTDRS